jgi:hypothetical protein
MITDQEKSENAANDVADFTKKALYQHEPLLLGSIMVIQGLGIFKSMLNESDYEEVCVKIYRDRNRVTKKLD